MNKYKKLSIIAFIFALCFCSFSKAVNATTNKCSSSAAIVLCNYENEEGYNFVIETCYDESNNSNVYYLFSRIDGKHRQVYLKANEIKYGTKDGKYNKNAIGINGTKMDGFVYFSKSAYSSLVKASSDYWNDNMGKTRENSKSCPKYIYQFKDVNGYNFCLANSDEYCNDAINSKSAKKVILFNSLAKNVDVGFSGETLADKAANNNDIDLEDIYGSTTFEKTSEIGCTELLGTVTNNNDPAYYINMAFNILKYIAIIILIVFTITAYLKAILSKDDDELNKATRRFIKRFIIAIIIFFLPTLIIVLLEWGGFISDSTLCGIAS